MDLFEPPVIDHTADVTSWHSVCPGGLWKVQLKRKHRSLRTSDITAPSSTSCPRLGSLCRVRVRLGADAGETPSSATESESDEEPPVAEVTAAAEVTTFQRRHDSALQLPLNRWSTLRLGEGQCDVTETCLERMGDGDTWEILLWPVRPGSDVSSEDKNHLPVRASVELQTFTPGLESWEMPAGEKWTWVQAHKERGGVRFRSGDVWGASDCYSRALTLLIPLCGCQTTKGAGPQQDPPSADQLRTVKAELHSNLSLCQLKLKQPERARTSAAKATELEPGGTKAWYRLGQACQTLNQLDQAKMAFRKVLELQPQSPAALKALKEVAVKEKETNAELGLRLSKMFC